MHIKAVEESDITKALERLLQLLLETVRNPKSHNRLNYCVAQAVEGGVVVRLLKQQHPPVFATVLPMDEDQQQQQVERLISHLIGPRGKRIRALRKDTGCFVELCTRRDVEQAYVYIAGPNQDAVKQARDRVLRGMDEFFQANL